MPPNILLINADDLGWKDLACFGSPVYETPHLDALAAAGRRYTAAYSAAANCAPSRASLMTGLCTRRHGILTVGSSERGKAATRRCIPLPNREDLDEGFRTLPQRLAGLGYATAHVGKWHISGDPCRHGFGANVAGCHQGHPKSYFAPYRNPALAEGPDGEYLPERLVREAGDRIDAFAAAGKPWFLYYATYLVHTPLQGKDEAIARAQARLAGIADPQGQTNPVYAAMVAALDQAVGTVLARLEASGQADNTLVIFTSDNGGIRAISEQTPLRGGKGSSYEGGIRVPTILRWPGRIPAGTSCTTPITQMDLLPTLVSLAGGTAEDVDGADITTTFAGPGEGAVSDRGLIWDFPVYLEAYDVHRDDGRDPLFRTRPGAVWREGRWKLHWFAEDDVCELYDLETDLGERHDRAATEPDRVARMRTALAAKIADLGGRLALAPNPVFDPVVEAGLLAEVVRTPAPASTTEADWYHALRFID